MDHADLAVCESKVLSFRKGVTLGVETEVGEASAIAMSVCAPLKVAKHPEHVKYVNEFRGQT